MEGRRVCRPTRRRATPTRQIPAGGNPNQRLLDFQLAARGKGAEIAARAADEPVRSDRRIGQDLLLDREGRQRCLAWALLKESAPSFNNGSCQLKPAARAMCLHRWRRFTPPAALDPLARSIWSISWSEMGSRREACFRLIKPSCRSSDHTVSQSVRRAEATIIAS